MSESPNSTDSFLRDVVSAWTALAPTAKFAGLTPAQFQAKVEPSFTVRTQIASLEQQLKALRHARKSADRVSNNEVLKIISCVRSASEFGEDSALYKAMGYVPKSERKSGLVRPSSTTTTIQAAPIEFPKAA
jgi:hypothetical protein